MPLVKTLQDRINKYAAKTAPDRVGTRYGAVKNLAINRYIDGISFTRTIVERARSILETEGVPAAFHGVYYGFVQQLAKFARSHFGKELDDIIAGKKAEFVAKGCDPAILDKLANLIG